ncbi:M56 family metallopeptidase [Pontibacter vulgaris]|uniref:M56 family metallopeptidase n=1 Tax=Pontibacter vulgaris TaxID=2905679 RepID=UPI001FA6DB5D|nr:M56 family metallopeptidase [Pontibacter vulgaris]
MNFSLNFLTKELTHALGWALLHSLWQGALAAIIVALLLIVLNRHSAKVRYMVSLLGMATVLVLFIVTFIHYYTSVPGPANASSPQELSMIQLQSISASPAGDATAWEQALASGKLYFAQHLPLLVSLWLMGLLVMVLRFLGSMAYVQRLRNYKTQTLGMHWQETLATLQQRMGVSRAVKLAESALVQVPVAIGYLKPVILLPVGAVTGLSQRQLEAILAHELAHIKRHDYFLNLLQQLAETIFFFHPAVWWMSNMARAEREHCCDDLAVTACGDTVTYARALAQLEELRMPAGPMYALALTGKKGSLLGRIKRLVNAPDLRPSFQEGFVAALVVVVGCMLLSYGAWAGLKEKQPEELALVHNLQKEIILKAPEKASIAVTEFTSPEAEALLASTLTIQDTTGKTSDLIIIKNKKGEISELYVNGRRIPKKDIPEFQKLIDQRLEQTRRAPRMSAKERRETLDATRRALSEVQRNRRNYNYNFNFSHLDSMDFDVAIPPVPPVPPMPPMPMVPPPPAPPAPPTPYIFGEDSKAAQKERAKEQERYKKEMKRYEQEMEKYGEELKKMNLEVRTERRIQRDNSGRPAPDMRRREEEIRIQRENMRLHEQSMKRHAEGMKRHEEGMKKHDEQITLLENVQKEMIKDGLVKEKAKEVDVKLDKTGLFINGKKQSQQLYEKYRGMMKNKEGKTLDFTIKKDSQNQQIMIND